MNIVRTTTDDGKRLVGVSINASTINEIRRTFGIWKNAAGTAEEIIRTVSEEHEIIALLGEIRIRQTRFQGNRVIEVCPATFEQIRELRETALINIIQNSRSRFFLPDDENRAVETLEKVLKLYPPISLLKSDGEALKPQNTAELDLNHSPVSLPDWLIEPPKEEVERILFRN